MGQSSSSEANPVQEEARPRIVVARELEGAYPIAQAVWSIYQQSSTIYAVNNMIAIHLIVPPVCFNVLHCVVCHFFQTPKEKIIQDFQNEQLQQAWNKVQISMLERRGQRTQAELEAEAQLQANRQAAQVAQARSAQLTQAMERLKAQFTDEAVAFEYDVKNLMQKQQGALALGEEAQDANNHHHSSSISSSSGGDENAENKALPCLGPRAHWIDCQKKYALDSRPCDSHLQALEKCVRQSILK